jgi:RNA polymerase sigma factor (sigma-70 family)
VRSPQLAEEIAQSTFLKLAQHARQLAPDTILSAWLYQVTRREAIDVVRREARRQLREQIATEMIAMNATAADWTHIEPLLDEAMHALDETDRAAVLLRYFENKSLREVGQALGASENAAQKRLTRAVERLREFFSKRGVSVGTSGLAVVISANAIQAAPVGLAVTISTAAGLAGAVITTTTSVTATQALTMTATKKALITAALAAAVGTGIYQARQASALRNKTVIHQQTALTEQLTSDRDDALRQLAALRAENDRLKGSTAELLKLRGEVTGLRRDAAKVAFLESELAKARSAVTEQIPPGASKLIISNPYLVREAWSDKGTDSPYHALETMLWASMSGNTERLADATLPGESPGFLKDRPPLMKIKGVQIVTVDGRPDGVTRVGAIVEEEFYGGGLDKPPGTVQQIRSWYLVQTNGEWKVTGEKVSW